MNDPLSVFGMFVGRTNASGGPHTARVFETIALKDTMHLLISQAGNELGTSKARGIRENHHETRSLLVPSSFPGRLKIRPQCKN